MTEPGLFDGLSPLGEAQAPLLAAGPFIVERTDPGGTLYDIGFDLTRADVGQVSWIGQWRHTVTPVQEPKIENGVISFIQEQDGVQYTIRPLQPGDAYLSGPSYESPQLTGPEDAQDAVRGLATILHQQQFPDSDPPGMGEDNLYLTRDGSGRPLALVKMQSGREALVRQEGAWLPLGDDSLLGESDIPMRDGAVLVWDSGNLASLNNWISDDRFSPNDAISLFVEVDPSDRVTRLILQRSANRFYSREHGQWVKATPDQSQMTVDVAWSAIGAWDDGFLKQLAQVEPYDVDGDQAA